jgi:intracellular multiplication protein IcmD
MRFKSLIVIILLTTIGYCYAGEGFGQFADNALGPVQGMGRILSDICLVGGIGMLLGAVLQYKAHRDNPSQVRLTTPIFLLVIGIAMVLLPFIGHLTSYHPHDMGIGL